MRTLLYRVGRNDPSHSPLHSALRLVKDASFLKDEANQPGQALDLLKFGLTIYSHDKDLGMILEAVGRCYLGLKKPELAFPAFEASLALQPRNRNALISAGYSLIQLRRYQEARVRFEGALDIFPSDLGALKGLVKSCGLSKDLSAATAYAERLNVLLGIMADKRPKPSAAPAAPNEKPSAPANLSVEEQMRERISANPRDIGARKVLAEIMIRRHEFGEAKKHLASILEIDKTNSEAKKLLAGISQPFSVASSGRELQEKSDPTSSEICHPVNASTNEPR